MKLKRLFRFRWRVWGGVVLCLTGMLVAVGVCHSVKPLPEGLSLAGRERAATELRFLKDLTYLNPDGKRESEQEIFDAVFAMIDAAKSFVLIDMFLFNDFTGADADVWRPISGQLTERLIEKRRSSPEVSIVFITDPINTVYGGLRSRQLERLQAAGVSVVVTNLEPLRDSNPVYSAFWRVFGRWVGNAPARTLPNPFGEGRVSLRSIVHLLNFKANHRKVVVADDDRGLVGLVTSANPHDGSSAHENVAIQFRGGAVEDLLEAERAVLKLSGADHLGVREMTDQSEIFLGVDQPTLQILSEGKIKVELLAALETAGKGDQIALVLFYFADRDVIAALIEARSRGAKVRLMLDPNRDAFGLEKNGLPNRQVAHELNNAGITVRWRETHGEQCHSKLVLLQYEDGGAYISLGSANYTRRNLNDLNLELNVAVRGQQDDRVVRDVSAYFDDLWTNSGGRQFSIDYQHYADPSLLRWIRYWAMERSGLCTF